MRNSPARRVALTGMLFALAVVLGWFEQLISITLALPPGVKLGLANVVVMYALLFINRRSALTLTVLKAAFALLTRGVTAGIMSFSGSMASVLVMMLLLLPKNKPSILLVSIAGSLFHNLGQLVAIRFLLNTFSLYYAPVLLVSGVVMGILTALLLRILLPALQKAKIAYKDSPDEKKQ